MLGDEVSMWKGRGALAEVPEVTSKMAVILETFCVSREGSVLCW